MAKVKLIGIGILALAIFIIVLQNTESVETRILFITLAMPRAVLLASTGLVGFLAGLLTAIHVGKKET